MAPAFTIDRDTGAIRIGEISLGPRTLKADAEARLGNLAHGVRDHGNGYQWLTVEDLSFAGEPCNLALCFHDGRLVEAGWSVALPNAPLEDGWPTREAVDQEVRFVTAVLHMQLGPVPASGDFPWGKVWSAYDDKGAIASNGLRYRTH